MKIQHLLILILLFLLCVLASNSKASEIGTTLYYSSGSYGLESETDFSYLSVFYKYKHKRWSIKAEIPYLSIQGPGSVIEGADTQQPLNRNDSGVGDTTLQARYLAHIFSNNKTLISYSGKIKAPTADDEKNLGSGKTDYSFQSNLYHRIENTTPFISVGYVWRGNSTGLNLNNGFKTTLGLDHRLNADYAFGYLYQYREAGRKTTVDIKSSTFYGNIYLASSVSLMAFLTFGHSDSTADHGLGTTLTFKF
jgi:hypothetical protein